VAFDGGKYSLARDIFDRITTDDDFVEFLTLPAYEYLP
jgi:malate synthase